MPYRLNRAAKRALSADESLHRYFASRMAQIDGYIRQRGRLIRVEQERPDGTIMVLQIARVVDTGEGLLVRVR